VLRNCVLDLVRDTGTRRAGAKHEKASLFPSRSADFERCHNGRKRDTTSTLHVIVEACDLGCVLVEDAPRVVEAEVFEMYVGSRIPLSAGVHEFVDELIVPLATHPLFSQAEIEIVFEQVLILA
jgi:hypothetical protein